MTLFESPELPISLQATIEVPECKMLTDSDLPIGRLRLLPGQQSDFSDEYYQRKHLPGEVLERKSNKQERDRLVQERNRLRYQVENLKAEVASAAFYANASPIRGSSAAAGSAPSSSANNNATGVTAHAERIKETERIKRKQLQELMDTLRRYEELLEPREPCNTGSTTGTPASAVAGAAGAAGRMWTTGGKGTMVMRICLSIPLAVASLSLCFREMLTAPSSRSGFLPIPCSPSDRFVVAR